MNSADPSSKYFDNTSPTKDNNYNSSPHENSNKTKLDDNSNKILHDQNIQTEESTTTNIVVSENLDNVESKNISTNGENSNYPITWLPAMVVSSESQNAGQSFMIETSGEGRSGSNLMSSNTFLHLPVSYSNDGSKIIGIVIGPNSVMPIESINNLNVVNFQNNFSKLSNENPEWAESLQNVKVDGDRNIETIGDINYSTITGEQSQIKDTPFCIYCNKMFKNMQEFHTHMLIEHPDSPQLNSYINDTNYIHPSLRICPSCGNQLSRVAAYDNPYPSETNEEEQNMGMGQPTSTTTIHLICVHCCKEFNLDIYNDPQQGHGSNQNIGDINISNTGDGAKRHYCDHCVKSYKHNRDLRKHLRTHHGIENSGQLVNTHPGSSAFPETLNNNQISNYHHDPQPVSAKLPCDICNKQFRGPFELRRHVHTVHENKRPYKCKDCFKVFRDAYELKRHSASHQRVQYHSVANSSVPLDPGSSVEMIHLPNLNDSQSDINKNQQNAQQLVTSSLLRDVYSGPQTSTYSNTNQPMEYFCSQCDKNFRGANEFKRHYSVVHEKKYRYKCIHCGKLWRDQYDLKRHCRRSHFVNQEIDKAFIRQCLLDNNNNENVSRQISATPNFTDTNPIPSMNITLDHEAVAAIFGTSNQDIQQSEMAIHPDSIQDPSAIMFQGMNNGLPSASMLYQSDENSHIGNSMIQPEDITIPDSNKDSIGWAEFENDMKNK